MKLRRLVPRTSAIRKRGGGLRGFTLVELLVVIAIIGILVSLLLPAVQSAREAARRMECSNKLKQLALALHHFHESRGRFPAGAVVADDSCTPAPTTERGPPWTVSILPYLEQRNRYDEFNLDGNFFSVANDAANEGPPDPANDAAQRKPLPAYQCPSDPNARSDEANTNYLGVQGGGEESDAECRNWFAANHRLLFDNGVLYRNSEVRIADIRDGTSNTFLAGETRWWFARGMNEPYGTHWTWASGFRAAGTLSNEQTNAAAVDPINNPLVDYDPGRPYAEQGGAPLLVATSSRCFGSHHRGGCHFAFADGSVHFIGESIDLNVYRSAGARSDGLPLGGIVP